MIAFCPRYGRLSERVLEEVLVRRFPGVPVREQSISGQLLISPGPPLARYLPDLLGIAVRLCAIRTNGFGTGGCAGVPRDV